MSFYTISAGALNGLLLGGLYACMALGLSMVFGVMRFINVAHGELLILAAFLSFVFSTTFGLHPLVAMLALIPVLFVLGYVMQRTLINPLMGAGLEPSLLTAFGLSIIAQNLMVEIWGGNTKSLNTAYAEMNAKIFGIDVPLLYIMSFFAGIVVTVGIHLFITRTYTGRAIRAATQDAATAMTMGINVNNIYAITAAIGAATAALGGTLIGMTFSFTPTTGFPWLLKGFVVVVLGGMGNIIGTLAGGLILGLSEGIGAAFVGTGYRDMIGYIIFLLVLMFRPTGLFGHKGSE
ncbi:MAG: branched-chain amino acid ABC transporter permease [Rhodospirillaceae bacterium]|nr:branched-chain amino acid ABC transporter permease [Rhodospirillaceae bacterium]